MTPLRPTPRQCAAFLAFLVCTIDAAAHGEQPDFARVTQTRGDFTAAYSVEVQRALESTRSSPGGGGDGTGGGLGGRRDYEGVTHRIAASYRALDGLSFGIEQSIRQAAANDLSLGVLAPEAVFRLPLPAPVDVSVFAAGRVRVTARRGSTLVLGAAVEKRMQKLSLLARAGFEQSVADAGERGARCQAGAAWRPRPWLAVAAEAWGALTWTEEAPLQHDHHAGPSVRFRLGRYWWLASNVGFGVKQRPSTRFTDVAAAFQVGVAL